MTELDDSDARPPGVPHGDAVPDDRLESLDRQLRGLARLLVREGDDADDAVQDAWVSALEEPEGRVRDWTAWLRQVVRHSARRRARRSDLRRHAERRAVDPIDADEATDGPDDALERRALAAMLRQSVDALREPYRTVLVLRFFDELSLDEIVQRTGRPNATVRSQLHRGLAELRDVLDRKHGGDRGRWLPAITALGHGGTPRAAHAVAAGSSFGLLGLVAAVLVVAALIWGSLRLLQPDRGADDATTATIDRPGEGGQDATDIAAVPAAGGAARAPAEEANDVVAAPTEGEQAPVAPIVETRRLSVTVLRADGAPNADAVVTVYGDERQPMGPYAVDGTGSVAIDVPVDRLMGRPLFVDREGVSVAAVGGGEARSFRYNVTMPPEGRSLEIRTRGRAQAIDGRVVDERGEPVRDAWVVLLGDARGAEPVDGGPAARKNETKRTDEEGRFRFENLARGAHRFQGGAQGLATVNLVREGEGDVLDLTMTLRDGASVRGLVRLADGRPAVRARVWEPDQKALLQQGSENETFTDDEGRFELVGLGIGQRHVFAQDAEDASSFATTILTIEVGRTYDWDPRLREHPRLRFRIEDENREPVAMATVGIFSIVPGAPQWGRVQKTDDAGEVVFHERPEGAVAAMVRRGDVADARTTSHPVQSGVDPIVIRLEPEPTFGKMHGVVLDAEGNAVPEAVVIGASGAEVFRVPCDPSTGVFSASSVLPAKYDLCAVAPSLGATLLGLHTVDPGANCEVGVHRFPEPAVVTFDWQCPPPSKSATWTLSAVVPGPVRIRDLQFLYSAVEQATLVPGVYLLTRGPTANTGPIDPFEFTVEGTEPVTVVVPER
ncbi:MAG: sigma-70 family RNA polymerase sigma factor [Planctomycetota bacterium]